MALAESIKMTRQKALMTQESFAEALHVSLATVNSWEVGKSKPNMAAMKAIKTFCAENNLSYEDIESEWLLTIQKRDQSK